MSKQVFVKVDKYKEILDIIDVIKTNIMQTRETISEINKLREMEDKTIDSWSDNLDEITHKVNEINSSLFEQDK